MAGHSSSDNGNRRFNRELDNHVKNRIQELLRNDRDYFCKIDARDTLRHFMDGHWSGVKERILRKFDNEGNRIAVDELMKEIPKRANFALTFLEALIGLGHRDIADKLLEGIRMELIPNSYHHETDRLRGGGDRQRSPPPSYDDIPDQLLREQDEKHRSFQQEPTRNISLSPSNLPPYDIQSPTSSIRPNDSCNELPSASTRDENYSAFTQSFHQPAHDNERESDQAIGGGAVPISTHDASLPIQNQQRNYIADGANGQQQLLLSDIRQSEMCISDDDEETVPKSPSGNQESSEEVSYNRQDAIFPPPSVQDGRQNNIGSITSTSSVNPTDAQSTVAVSTQFFDEPSFGKNMGTNQSTVPFKSVVKEATNGNPSSSNISNNKNQDESRQSERNSADLHYVVILIAIQAALLIWSSRRP